MDVYIGPYIRNLGKKSKNCDRRFVGFSFGNRNEVSFSKICFRNSKTDRRIKLILSNTKNDNPPPLNKVEFPKKSLKNTTNPPENPSKPP